MRNNLQDLSNDINKLVEEAKSKGLDPTQIKTLANHSGIYYELCPGNIKQVTGDEEAGPICDMDKGTIYAGFYLD